MKDRIKIKEIQCSDVGRTRIDLQMLAGLWTTFYFDIKLTLN